LYPPDAHLLSWLPLRKESVNGTLLRPGGRIGDPVPGLYNEPSANSPVPISLADNESRCDLYYTIFIIPDRNINRAFCAEIRSERDLLAGTAPTMRRKSKKSRQIERGGWSRGDSKIMES